MANRGGATSLSSYSKELDTILGKNYNLDMKNYSYDEKNSRYPQSTLESRFRLDKNIRKILGFTLSEVLITLGIIGIVAALTIPTLVNRLQELHFHAKWKECYALLNNAFNMVLAEDPTIMIKNSQSYYIRPEFIEALLSHLQVIDTCGDDNLNYDKNRCDNYAENKNVKYKWSGFSVTGNFDNFKTLAGTTLRPEFNHKAALLKNGAAVYIGGIWRGYMIVVDVNNHTAGPNTLGKDVYAICLTSTSWKHFNEPLNVNSLHFKPFGAEGTLTEINGYSGCDPNIGSDADTIVALYEAPGAGCSYKYLSEK